MTTNERSFEGHPDARVRERVAEAGGDRPASAAGSGSPRFYSVAQVAEMLGMAPVTLYRAIREGQFPAVRIRGRLIVPAKAVDAIVNAAVADSAFSDAAYRAEEGGRR